MPDPTDPLDDLRDALHATEEAAQRLRTEVPPQGWASPADAQGHTDEVQALAALLQGLRDLVPEELQEQFRAVLRQVLLLLRAVIDFWVDRMEGAEPAPAPASAEVRDIPVE